MRKIYTLLLLGVATLSNAQVPNSDFEAGFGYGGENVADWGQFFLYTVTLDENTNEYVQDDITFGDATLGLFCSSVPDPHSGERAMLIRNAFNNTTNQVIPGKVNLFNSAISEQPTGWNTGIPVDADAQINSLGFWYKFNRVGNDVAEAKLELFNSDNENIGTAKILISESATEYTYVAVPLTATIVSDPAFLTIAFSMEAENSTATFGSFLIVDDLSVNGILATNQFETSAFTIFPTVSDSEINIRGTQGIYNVLIYDVCGQIVNKNQIELQNGVSKAIDISRLSDGVYVLKAENNGSTIAKKFIKK